MKTELKQETIDAIASAHNIANQLVSRIREAHATACVNSPTIAEKLVERHLLKQIETACNLNMEINNLWQSVK